MQLVFLGVGPSSYYLEDSPVPITFTARTFKSLVAEAELPKPATRPSQDETRAIVERELKRAENYARKYKQALMDSAREYHDTEAIFQVALRELAAKEDARMTAHSALAAAHARWESHETALRTQANPLVWVSKKQAEESKKKIAEFRAEKYGPFETALKAAEEAEVMVRSRAKYLEEMVSDAKARREAAKIALERAEKDIERLEDQISQL
jgi:hypothetical protein